MTYLAATTYDDIRRDPNRIEHYYDQIWRGFAKDVGIDMTFDLPDPVLRGAFAGIVASQLFEYGPEPAGVIDLPTLLKQKTIACDDFTRVTWQLIQLMPACARLEVVGLGWNGGAIGSVGNHSQLMLSDGRFSLLVDATVGLVARCDRPLLDAYDALFDPAVPIISSTTFFGYAPRPNVPLFPEEVRKAVANRLYRPSTALYFVADFNLFQAPGSLHFWPTPQAQLAKVF